MNRTGIELGTHSWNLVTGCREADICAVSAGCCAPTLHPGRLADRMPRKPARILVSWTGEMFGEWWRTQNNLLSNWEFEMFRGDFTDWSNPELGEWDKLVLRCLGRATQHPEHQFLFLTKNPAAYRLFNPWPPNAWLGASITGAEPRDVQQARLDALRRTEGAGVLWVSYEPMLGPLLVDDLYDIGWLVMGAHNRGKVKPMREWVDTAWSMADARSPVIPVWEKDNLFKALFLPWEPVQELPELRNRTQV